MTAVDFRSFKTGWFAPVMKYPHQLNHITISQMYLWIETPRTKKNIYQCNVVPEMAIQDLDFLWNRIFLFVLPEKNVCGNTVFMWSKIWSHCMKFWGFPLPISFCADSTRNLPKQTQVINSKEGGCHVLRQYPVWKDILVC